MYWACEKLPSWITWPTQDAHFSPQGARFHRDAFFAPVAAYCKLPLAPARVLSIASRANAKILHALWPVRAPTSRLRQSERYVPAAPIRTRELSSCLSGQRRILTHFGASRPLVFTKCLFARILNLLYKHPPPFSPGIDRG